MTSRENIMGIFRKTGYEWAPVQFSLCPSQVATYKKETGGKVGYDEYFDFPWKGIKGPVLPAGPPVDWSKYFDHELKPGTQFTVWGVGQEPGDAAAFHMKRFLHPMKNFTSLEQFQSYPYPDYAKASYDHMAAHVEEIHRQGYAAMGGIGSFVWESGCQMSALRMFPFC